MSKRPSQPGLADADALPPIPDGGLSTSMPDWLRAPPAWRGPLEPAAPAKVVPEPDTSPIDPGTILTLEDLPVWLQRIAAGRGADAAPEVTTVSHSRAAPPEAREREEHVADAVGAAKPGSPVVVEGSDDSPAGVGPATAVSGPAILSATSRSEHRPWWQSGALTALLFICLVIALLVIAYYATGVF